MAKTKYIFSSRPERHPIRLFFKVVALLLAATIFMGALGSFIVTHSVQLIRQRVTVQTLPEGLENFTILVISDLHGEEFGKHQNNIKTAINNTPVSCIVFAGDMCGPGGDATAFLDLVASLPADTHKYLLPGDEDPDATVALGHGSVSVFSDWIVQAQDAGVILLDRPMKETRNKSDLYLVPAYLYDMDLDAMESAYTARLAALDALTMPTADDLAARRLCLYQLQRVADIREIMAGMKAKDTQVAVTHVPMTNDYIRTQQTKDTRSILALKNVPLVIAGHYCSGQWRLPGVGALYNEDFGWFPDDKDIIGLGYHTGLWQYISPGLGAPRVSVFPGRVYSEPAVTILTLTSRIV